MRQVFWTVYLQLEQTWFERFSLLTYYVKVSFTSPRNWHFPWSQSIYMYCVLPDSFLHAPSTDCPGPPLNTRYIPIGSWIDTPVIPSLRSIWFVCCDRLYVFVFPFPFVKLVIREVGALNSLIYLFIFSFHFLSSLPPPLNSNIFKQLKIFNYVLK